MKNQAIEQAWFTIFLLCAFASRVNRLICIRIVRLCLSTWLVDTCRRSGKPINATFLASWTLAGVVSGLQPFRELNYYDTGFG